MSNKTKTTTPREDRKPGLVPSIRFPEFQNAGEWDVMSLGQISKLVRGPFGGSLKKEIFVASGYAVYEQSHAIYAEFGSFRYYINEEKFRELKRFAVAPNDIIMSCSGTMGKFALIPTGAAAGVINQALLKLTVVRCCNPKFLKALLELPNVQEKLLSQSAGGAIQNVVSVDQIKALQLPLPSEREQKMVVDCLTTLDDLIAAQTQKLEALKTHKKGLMQQLFPREGEAQPRLRFPEFQNAGEWEDTTLGQLAKLVRGPFGGSLKKDIFVASGYAVYEQQHAIYSDFSSFRYHITADKFHELRRFAVAANDIIMSCSGTMGKLAIIPGGATPGVINQALLKLTPNGSCDTRFLKAVLELPTVQEKLLSQSAGGAIQNVVSVDQIKALPLRLPSGDEQQAVVDCLSSLDALITAETQKHEALKTHKKGLMQQLFPSPEEQNTL